MSLLRWKGDILLLGKTPMAELRANERQDLFNYVLGPEDYTSEPYENLEDARQDCERHTRSLLRKAGVEDE